MAWNFADSFDLYAVNTDMIAGYWDNLVNPGPNFLVFGPGRFPGSQAITVPNGNTNIVKNSGVNDQVHHIVISFMTTWLPAASANSGLYLAFLDGATGQCFVQFNQDGSIKFYSGTYAGTTTLLATYANAFTINNIWFGFEFEIVISNTAGSIAVRKNGNTVNDFIATGLNTRPVSTNNYANRLQIGQGIVNGNHYCDDLFWQSGAVTGNWLGDIRCYTRMPATDAQKQFTQGPNPVTQVINVSSSSGNTSLNPGNTFYQPFIAGFTGTINSIITNAYASYTMNMKLAIYDASNGGNPGNVLGTSNPLVNPITGNNIVTFPTPPSVTKGTTYWLAFVVNGACVFNSNGVTGNVNYSNTSYAAFPVANPTLLGPGNEPLGATLNVMITPAVNNQFVGEFIADSLNSYIYDSNIGDADFYGVAGIAANPSSVTAVVTRAYMQKSDAGTRTAAVQIKSGSAVSASPTLVLSSSQFLWAWQINFTDPNTGGAWTGPAVNNVQIGPKVIA